MNVHQATRRVHVCARVCAAAAVVKVCKHLYVQRSVCALPLLVQVFGHTSLRSLERLESSLCLAAGHKNNL